MTVRDLLRPIIGDADAYQDYRVCDKCDIIYKKNNFNKCPGCELKENRRDDK